MYHLINKKKKIMKKEIFIFVVTVFFFYGLSTCLAQEVPGQITTIIVKYKKELSFVSFMIFFQRKHFSANNHIMKNKYLLLSLNLKHKRLF